jgi:hypothetical protein
MCELVMSLAKVPRETPRDATIDIPTVEQYAYWSRTELPRLLTGRNNAHHFPKVYEVEAQLFLQLE